LTVTHRAKSFGFSRTTVLDGVHYRTKNISVEKGTHRERFNKIEIIFFTEQTQRQLSLWRMVKNKT
jgi:hypothetical protein